MLISRTDTFTLTWKDRFKGILDLELAHNFYSLGEDVVAANDDVNSASILATFLSQGFDVSYGAWKAQELVKGVHWTTSLASLFMARGQAGWDKDGVYNSVQLENITNEELKIRPYFDDFKESDLIHTNATIASAKADQIKVLT